MKNNQILGALALDLKRAAIGYFRGSKVMADRFHAEALKRRKELDNKKVQPYLVKFLDKIENLKNEEQGKAAEDALLYSTLVQNAAIFRIG